METMQTDYTKCAAKGDERLKSTSERQWDIVTRSQRWVRTCWWPAWAQAEWLERSRFHLRAGLLSTGPELCFATLKSSRFHLETPLLRGLVFLHGISVVKISDLWERFPTIKGQLICPGKGENHSESSAEIPKSCIQRERATQLRVWGVKPDHQFTIWAPGGCTASPQAGWRQTSFGWGLLYVRWEKQHNFEPHHGSSFRQKKKKIKRATNQSKKNQPKNPQWLRQWQDRQDRHPLESRSSAPWLSRDIRQGRGLPTIQPPGTQRPLVCQLDQEQLQCNTSTSDELELAVLWGRRVVTSSSTCVGCWNSTVVWSELWVGWAHSNALSIVVK